mmetsp:Transcript_60395/g.99632  ORF Transcript_60395/g.99632 Transcript_60395/m.99632 type:complete len:312 (-) Transcript_60395:41-976(-)|eukprot:CAMPEP_0202700880 /NCGR_PEP_ID=MMETSP1385-20130828/14026_1 /ASSEMBLY_ACC=CAM_ASM_000861 /TAXON_ID=933848 /ORGANISM="Elphidium margaritaceum" /LENGTH=311 /DNA_ID=CAMNT_0049358167 /DNA_START=19 /DNA_END=954 /DNA_ORIENTATION=-
MWSENQLLALEVVSVLFSAVSFLCDALIMLSYYKFKELRKFAYSFVFYIAVANMMREFAKLWGASFRTGTFGCSLQAFLINYGGLSSFWWIETIAIIMYTMIFVEKFWNIDSQQIQRRKRFFVVVNFSFPFLFALIPLFTGSYGNVGGWCWIVKDNEVDHALRYVCYYGHLILILFICVFVYLRIWLYLRHKLNMDSNAEAQHGSTVEMYDRIKFYPLCLIIGFGFGAFRRILQSITGNQLPFSFAIIHAVTTGLFGVLVLCFYGRVGQLKQLYMGPAKTGTAVVVSAKSVDSNEEPQTADITQSTQPQDV